MLYHHDKRPYQVALQQANEHFRGKLTHMMDTGPEKVAGVLNKLREDSPIDMVAPAKRLEVGHTDNNFTVFVDGDEPRTLTLHPNAFGQMVDKADVTTTYAQKRMEGGPAQRELLVHDLNTLLHLQDRRFMLREVRGEVRGWLSDKFRRMDSFDIIEAFAQNCEAMGIVPVEADYGAVRWAVKGLYPSLFEPVEGEVMALGVALQNSDYGCGALSLRTFIVRLMCTNLAMLEEMLRQVHLGKRLEANFAYSQQTYELDTKTVISALGDHMSTAFSTENTTKVCEAMGMASEEQMEPGKLMAELRRLLPTKKLAEEARDIFTGMDVVNLPPGNTRLRLSNSVSWLAGKQEDAVTRLKLQELAGRVLIPTIAEDA